MSRGGEDLHGGLRDLRLEVIGERVWPEEDRRTFSPRCEPASEGGAGEGRQGALGSDAGQAFDERRQRAARHGVGEAGGERGQARPAEDQARRIRERRTGPSLIVVMEELGLVGGEIDPGRAVAFASFARQAEVEGLAHLVAPPTVREDVPGEHLEQQAGAAPGRMLLLTGYPPARAHDRRPRGHRAGSGRRRRSAAPRGRTSGPPASGRRSPARPAERAGAGLHPGAGDR